MATRVVVLGAGGHASVIIDTLRLTGEYAVVGCISKEPPGTLCLDVPVLGTDDVLGQLKDRYNVERVIIAVGSIELRKELAKKAKAAGLRFAKAVHPRAVVSGHVTLGEGVAVLAGAVINPRARVGCHAIINTGATVDHDCVIGDYVNVSPGVHVAGNVTLRAGCFIGIGASIVEKVSVGEDSIVGAGAVVIRDVPPGTVVAGVPARPIRSGAG